ncbi:D-alanyl-D-alanine carboxypeptidase [Agromyces ramosus]|uniref:D-alanyl-D-alanine carboxypeptidase n=2 Tax=Agromyces ramosus TaxID=33879 RepID=A0ABU0R7E4_9MICO|nr:D-alanyl-D-alanine carboxypeptidase [Agromyces ramosus]
MADLLGARRRRIAPAAVLLTVLAMSACTGGTIDPATQFNRVDVAVGDDLSTSLQALLDEAVALSGSSGGVAGVWAPWAGEWQGSSGSVSFEEGAPAVTPETRFHMAAVTTEITCTILLRLVDEGSVALDDEVTKYVDWIPGLDGITLEQLCRHTSGLPDYYPALRTHFLRNPERIWPAGELVASGLAMSRVGPPGEQWSYSRTGVLLLSLALERTTGRSWNDLAKQYVLGPLGLDDTELPSPEDTVHDDALGAYSASVAQDGTVDCAVVLDDSKQSSSIGGAAAGAVTTLDDLHRLSEAFATGSLISEQSLRERWEPTPLGGDTPAWQRWGIGGAQYGPMRGSAGEAPGAITAAFTDPESGLTVAVALNNSTSGDAFVREVAFALASIGSKAPPAPDHEQPLVELPWSLEQATAKMHELAKCPTATDAAAETTAGG